MKYIYDRERFFFHVLRAHSSAIGPAMVVSTQAREAGGLGVSPNMRQPGGVRRVLDLMRG